MSEHDFFLNIVNKIYYWAIGVLLKIVLMIRVLEDQKYNDDLVEIGNNVHDILKVSIVDKSNILRY